MKNRNQRRWLGALELSVQWSLFTLLLDASFCSAISQRTSDVDGQAQGIDPSSMENTTFNSLKDSKFPSFTTNQRTHDIAGQAERRDSSALEHTTSYSLKKCFGRMLNKYKNAHTRQKRTAFFTVKFPQETELLIKWSILTIMPSEEKYETELAIALAIERALPSYLSDPEYDLPFDYLFGGFQEPPEEPAEAGAEERKKRNLHVQDRQEVYAKFENMMESQGLPGRECLHRTVCEIADANLHFGFIGDILNLMFTPSSAAVSTPSGDLMELETLLAAEQVGRRGQEKCQDVYSSCPSSVFDILPIITHKMLQF